MNGGGDMMDWGCKGVQRGAKGDKRCVRSNAHVGNLSIDAGRGTAQ